MKLLNRLLPHPLLTLMLTVIWQLLVNKFSLNSLLFGFLLGLLIPIATQPYWPNRPKLKSPPPSKISERPLLFTILLICGTLGTVV